MKSEVREALEVLQSSPPSKKTGQFPWLDQHKEQVLIVWRDKGEKLTEELLALGKSMLYQWARSRGLPLPSGHVPSHRPTVNPPAPRGDADYWRGRAEALWDVLKLLRARKEEDAQIPEAQREGGADAPLCPGEL